MSPLITPDMKVDQVLDRYPGTLDTFVSYGFKPLRNPVLRKTFAHLVTIRAATRMHRWDDERLARFLADLNARALAPAEVPPDAATAELPLYDLRDVAGMRAQQILVSDVLIEIDNRGLEPPEPMVRILAIAQQLGARQRLVALNVRRPMLLYPKLEELGYHHLTEETPEGHFRITVSRSAAP